MSTGQLNFWTMFENPVINGQLKKQNLSGEENTSSTIFQSVFFKSRIQQDCPHQRKALNITNDVLSQRKPFVSAKSY